MIEGVKLGQYTINFLPQKENLGLKVIKKLFRPSVKLSEMIPKCL